MKIVGEPRPFKEIRKDLAKCEHLERRLNFLHGFVHACPCDFYISETNPRQNMLQSAMAGMIFTRGHVQTDIGLEEKAWEQHVGITIGKHDA